ncbi:MAG: hypothetical protein ABJC66_15515 [Gammaproteobacteria bacterium]
MNELGKLKKENKRLKALLKNAVEILDRYRDFLKHPEKLGLKPKKKTSKDQKSSKDKKKA